MQRKLMKNLLLVVAMVVLCLAVGMSASALEPTGQCGDNVYWNYDEITGELVISGEGDMWEYRWESPFSNTDIKSVVIKNDVTNIGVCAFRDCGSLENVTIPDSVTNICGDAFANCTRLKSITIPYGVTGIGEYAFSGCFALETVIIPDSVTYIGNEAFSLCINLKNVSLPDNDTAIDIIPFFMCASLKDITIPQSMTTLDYGDFACIPCLESITVKSLDIQLEEGSLGLNGVFAGLTDEEIYELFCITFIEGSDEANDELTNHLLSSENWYYKGTIYCHSGSTAEAYAIANGIDYVLTHFFEGDWTYDYDNLIKYRKCIHCDELETEAIEPEVPAEPEPDTPTTPDEEIKDNFFSKIFELIKAFIDLLFGWINR